MDTCVLLVFEDGGYSFDTTGLGTFTTVEYCNGKCTT